MVSPNLITPRKLYSKHQLKHNLIILGENSTKLARIHVIATAEQQYSDRGWVTAGKFHHWTSRLALNHLRFAMNASKLVSEWVLQ